MSLWYVYDLETRIKKITETVKEWKNDGVIIEPIDKLIAKLNPASRFTGLHKNYLVYLKSLILFKKGRSADAKQIIESLISTLSENDIYTTYDDINDFYVEIMNL